MVTLENDAVGAALPLVGVHRVVVVTHECGNPVPVQRQIAPAALLCQRCLHRPAKHLVAVASQTLGEFAQAVEQPGCKEVGPSHLSMGCHKIRALLLHVVAQDALHTGVKSILQADDGYPFQPLSQLQGHRATAHMATFVLQHQRLVALRTLLEHIDG